MYFHTFFQITKYMFSNICTKHPRNISRIQYLLLIILFSHINIIVNLINFFKKFFFRDSFNLWYPLLIITLYYQIKTPISFWYKWGLNPESLIQPSLIKFMIVYKIHMRRKSTQLLYSISIL